MEHMDANWGTGLKGLVKRHHRAQHSGETEMTTHRVLLQNTGALLTVSQI